MRIALTFVDPEKLGHLQPKRDTVRAQVTSARGEQVSQRWEAPERIGKYRCWLRVRYEIEIKYDSTTLVPLTVGLTPA